MVLSAFVIATSLIFASTSIVSASEPDSGAMNEFVVLNTIFSDPPAEELEDFIMRFSRRSELAEQVLGNDEALVMEILAQIEKDPEVLRQTDSPEWIHGMEVFNPGFRTDFGEAIDVLFLDNSDVPPTDVWVVGWEGLISHSEKDGIDFQQQNSGTPENLWSVDFVDRLHGFVAGDSGIVLRTKDGGATWQPVPLSPVAHNRSIECIDRKNCWVVGMYPYVFSTRNGGRTWSPSKQFIEGTILWGIQMFSETSGVVVGTNGVWRTDDKGRFWTQVFGAEDDEKLRAGDSLTGVHTFDGVNIWAVGQLGGQLGILRSADSGATWQRQSDRIFDLGSNSELVDHVKALTATSVSVVSADIAFLAAKNGAVLSTIDGGRHWWIRQAKANPNYSHYAIAMRDRRVGWTAGNHGHVEGTHSGGETWVGLRGLIYDKYEMFFDAVNKTAMEGN